MLLALLTVLGVAQAGALNPWGSATAPGVALVNPYVYVYSNAVNPIVYASAGLSDHVDVYAGFGATLPNEGAGVGSLEFFPRYFVNPSLALAAHVYWTPAADALVLAPEIHANHTWDRFAITANAGWRPVLGSNGFSTGTVPIIVAPELRLSSRFSLYVEVDPTISLGGDPVAMLLVPGVGVTLDSEGHHTLSTGLQVPVLPDVGAASFGVWYCFSFSTENPA